jgi:selenoprotein W-related protein
LADKIEAAYKEQLGKVELVASGGGCFELSLDDKLLYSKLETGSFPDEDDVMKLIGEHLG